MSKAVLVMDMPERCVKCPLLLTLPQKDGFALCIARPKSGQEEYNPNNEKTWRPDWAHSRNCRRDQIIQSIVTMEGSMQGGTDA